MRVIALATVVLVCVGTAAARAQVPDGASPVPSRYAGAAADVTWVSLEGISGAAVRLGAHAEHAPLPALAVGAGLDLRGGYVSDDENERGSGRAGLGALRLWIGTGGAVGRWELGARLVASAGSRLVGLSSIDGGTPQAAGGVQLDGALDAGDIALEATLVSAVIWDGAASVALEGELDVGWQDVAPGVGAFLGLEIEASPPFAPAPRLRAGAELDLEPASALALVAIVGMPGDLEGHVVSFSASYVRPL